MCKTLIFMRGVPGSGKSFTANKLLKENPHGVIHSTDSYFGYTPEEYRINWNPVKLGYYHQLNQKAVQTSMDDGTPLIIVDNTNIKLKEMKPYVQSAEYFGYNVVYKEPESYLWNYWRNGMICTEHACHLFAERTVHNVPVETIRRMLDSFQELPLTEKM